MKKVRYSPSAATNLAAARARSRFLHFDMAFTESPTELEEDVIEAAAARQATASMAIEGRRADRPVKVRSTAEARKAVADIFEAGARQDRGPGPESHMR